MMSGLHSMEYITIDLFCVLYSDSDICFNETVIWYVSKYSLMDYNKNADLRTIRWKQCTQN